MKQKTLVIGAAVALLAVFAVGALLYKSQTPVVSPERLAMLERSYAPTVGDAAAKVHIVEFLDPACGTCAAFYPFVKRILAKNPGKIRLSIRYAPFHQGSDQVVAALEAARKQGKFWEALEMLLSTQAQWAPNHVASVDLAWQPLARAGVDVERAKMDMGSPEIARNVRQDIDDARGLGVKATPEYFVNGRGLPSFGYEELQRLVDEALAREY